MTKRTMDFICGAIRSLVGQRITLPNVRDKYGSVGPREVLVTELATRMGHPVAMCDLDGYPFWVDGDTFLYAAETPFRERLKHLIDLDRGGNEPEDPLESMQEAVDLKEKAYKRTLLAWVEKYRGQTLTVAPGGGVNVYTEYNPGKESEEVYLSPGQRIRLLGWSHPPSGGGWDPFVPLLLWVKLTLDPDPKGRKFSIDILSLMRETVHPLRSWAEKLALAYLDDLPSKPEPELPLESIQEVEKRPWDRHFWISPKGEVIDYGETLYHAYATLAHPEVFGTPPELVAKWERAGEAEDYDRKDSLEARSMKGAIARGWIRVVTDMGILVFEAAKDSQGTRDRIHDFVMQHHSRLKDWKVEIYFQGKLGALNGTVDHLLSGSIYESARIFHRWVLEDDGYAELQRFAVRAAKTLVGKPLKVIPTGEGQAWADDFADEEITVDRVYDADSTVVISGSDGVTRELGAVYLLLGTENPFRERVRQLRDRYFYGIHGDALDFNRHPYARPEPEEPLESVRFAHLLEGLLG